MKTIEEDYGGLSQKPVMCWVVCTGINEKPVNTGNRCLLRSGAPNGSFR